MTLGMAFFLWSVCYAAFGTVVILYGTVWGVRCEIEAGEDIPDVPYKIRKDFVDSAFFIILWPVALIALLAMGFARLWKRSGVVKPMKRLYNNVISGIFLFFAKGCEPRRSFTKRGRKGEKTTDLTLGSITNELRNIS